MKGLTFKQFLLEYEFHIPKSTYGYWITDDGEFVTVDHTGHPKALTKLPIAQEIRQHATNERYKGSVYAYVFDKGWVRIIDIETDYNPNLNVDISIEFDVLTQKSYYALMAFLKDREQRRSNADLTAIFIDSSGGKRPSKEFNAFRNAIRYVNTVWNSQ